MNPHLDRVVCSLNCITLTLTEPCTGQDISQLDMPRNDRKARASESQGRITSGAVLIQRRNLYLDGYISRNTSPGFYSTLHRKPKELTIGRLTSTALGEFDDFLTDTLINQVSLLLITNSTVSNCLQVFQLLTRKFDFYYQPGHFGGNGKVIATLLSLLSSNKQRYRTAVLQLLQLIWIQSVYCLVFQYETLPSEYISANTSIFIYLIILRCFKTRIALYRYARMRLLLYENLSRRAKRLHL